MNPNPAHDNVTISIDLKEDAVLNVQLMDVSGKIVLSDNETGTAGLNVYHLDLSHVSKGVYMLEVSEQGEKKNMKIVIE